LATGMTTSNISESQCKSSR